MTLVLLFNQWDPEPRPGHVGVPGGDHGVVHRNRVSYQLQRLGDGGMYSGRLSYELTRIDSANNTARLSFLVERMGLPERLSPRLSFAVVRVSAPERALTRLSFEVERVGLPNRVQGPLKAFDDAP